MGTAGSLPGLESDVCRQTVVVICGNKRPFRRLQSRYPEGIGVVIANIVAVSTVRVKMGEVLTTI